MGHGAEDHIPRVRDLVHRLDDLETRRAQIEVEITEVTNQLTSLISGRRAPVNLTTLPRTIAQGAAAVAKTMMVAEIVEDVAAEIEANTAGAAAGTYAEQALAAIQKNPKISYTELAVVLYGNETEVSKNKARSVMHFLMKKAKKVTRDESGTWSLTVLGTMDLLA